MLNCKWGQYQKRHFCTMYTPSYTYESCDSDGSPRGKPAVGRLSHRYQVTFGRKAGRPERSNPVLSMWVGSGSPFLCHGFPVTGVEKTCNRVR